MAASKTDTLIIGIVERLADKLASTAAKVAKVKAKGDATICELLLDRDDCNIATLELEHQVAELENDVRLAKEIMTPKQRVRFDAAMAESREIPF